MDRSQDRWKRPKSAAEIEAVARIADCLFELERREALADAQIVSLAQAIDALELGAFAAVPPLTDAARAAPAAPAEQNHAHALVQRLALAHLRAKFLRFAGHLDPAARWR